MASGRIKGITIEIDGDTTKLTNAIKQSEQQIRQSTSNLKDIDKLLKMDPGNTELLTQKYKNLQTELEGARDKLTKLKEAQEQMVKEGKVGTEEYDALQREIVETEQKVKSLTNEMKEFGSVSAQKIAAAGEKMKDFGDKVSRVGTGLTAGITAPVMSIATAAVKTTAEFDTSMSKVAAISGATGSEFEALRNKAREMGETTKYTASDAAEAMNYMAMAGWKTQDMLDGIAGVMNLAAASGEDLSTTSDIVTDALTAFGLKASDSSHFADILAKTAANANTNVGMMGQSFKYVAPVAGAMGYSAEDCAIALGLMANSGIKADMAGTSLRNMLTNMANPTESMAMAMDRLGLSLADDQGHMYTLQELMNQLRKGMTEINMPLEEYNAQLDQLDKQLEDGTLTQKKYDAALEELNKEAFGAEGAEKARAAAMLGGKRAMAALLAISEAAPEDYAALTESIYNCEGAAQQMADTMMDNAEGQWQILLSKVQELAISIGDILMPVVRDIIDYLQQLVDKFNSLDDSQKELIVKIALAAAAVGPVLIVIGKVITAIGTIMTFVPQIVGAIGAIATFITGTAIPAISGLIATAAPLIAAALPVIAVAGLVVAAGVLVVKNWDEIKEAGALLVERTQEHWENIKNNVTEAASTLKERTTEHFENLKQGISERFDLIVEAANTLNERTTEHFENLKNNLQERFNIISEAVSTFKDQAVEHFENFKNSVRERFENVQEAANTFKERIRENFDSVKQKIDDAINAVKQKFEDMKNGLNSAIDNIKQKLDTFKQKFDDIKSHIQGVVDWLKGCFNFDWKLPDLKLPHISISGSFSIDPPSAPHFSIDWYAKAMEKGMILNSPTIFGAAGDKLLGAGEAGSEAIVGTDSLQSMITSAVAAGGYGGDIIIPLYVGNTRLETMVVKAQQINDYRSGGR